MPHFDQPQNNENGERATGAGTFGPAYDKKLDGPRLNPQHERIRDWMLAQNAYKTLPEIHQALGFPETSISAQLRHLRKRQFGSYRVWKRRRKSGRGGTWEYKILPAEKPATLLLFAEPAAGEASR